MRKELAKVALRHNALFLEDAVQENNSVMNLNETTIVLVANCNKLGFTFSEELLAKVNTLSPIAKLELLEELKEAVGVGKNWMPLVKQWDNPTGEGFLDHVFTFLANVFYTRKGTRLACGHLIPEGTFPLERYNGCPYCGKQFDASFELDLKVPSKLKVLELWTDNELKNLLSDLLKSPVALDATQAECLEILVANFGVSDFSLIGMKETQMIVIDVYCAKGESELVSGLFSTPNDILRYIWYKHTGFLQLVELKVILKRTLSNTHMLGKAMVSDIEKQEKGKLKLKFSRAECKRYAEWLNGLTLTIESQCEAMHPKREIWVRVIRALRLAEYSKRKGFERLRILLDTFYNERYEVWNGQVNHFRLKIDSTETFRLLKQRPGLFARSLFSNMLYFGADETLANFREIMYSVPARLIFSLNMYAEYYFVKNGSRTVKPLGAISKRIPTNKLLNLYSNEDLEQMCLKIQELSLEVITKRFSELPNENKTIYLDESLFHIPLAIGDRSSHVQDLIATPMGTRFSVAGEKVRLFMHWGEGLPAQHLDMDLSCSIVYDETTEYCSYSNLETIGCKHSGDVQRIPDKIGAVEYIELDLEELTRWGAKYVSFTCNAFTSGGLSANLKVGWMNSGFPMKIMSNGVAYNPGDVQREVRIKQGLDKGMVFGVLDVIKREIIWLEMPFGGQIVQNMNAETVLNLTRKLDAKLKIGEVLTLKAKIQGLDIVTDPSLADELYDLNWASNSAKVATLILGN
ncbi:hypothetical protein [Fluviicola sp.]|uniref:hypothetical protein n=1 Tax=Fluviicola sp. TaxID=1917219 RepID=UPI003D2B3C9B